MNTWLAVGDDIEGKIINLCARGESDEAIVEMLDEHGVDATSRDIAAYRRRNNELITNSAIAQARDIMLSTPRSKQHFRVAELDSVLNELRQGFSRSMAEGDVGKAGKLADTYFKGLRLVAEEVGDLHSVPQGNRYIALMQNATPSEKRQLVDKMQEMRDIVSGINDDVIDAEIIEVSDE